MRARALARARARAREGGEGRAHLRGRLPLIALGVALAAFVVGYGITVLAFGAAAGPTDVAMVPDVRELTLPAASRILDDEELALEIGDSLPNMNAAAGTILAQSPLPGEEVSPGTAVRVIVSTGQPKLTVPNVDAMPLSLATRALEAVGFTVTTEEVPGVGQVGRVLDVNPAAGTAVPLPATVHVRVGAGPPLIEMPTVIGMLEAGARDLLESLGLRVTEVQYERSSLGEPGGVVSQSPAPGDSVAIGEDVRLRVTEPRESDERGITRRDADRPNRENR